MTTSNVAPSGRPRTSRERAARDTAIWASCARGRTQAEVAAEHGLSRRQVQRILDACERDGLGTGITIDPVAEVLAVLKIHRQAVVDLARIEETADNHAAQVGATRLGWRRGPLHVVGGARRWVTGSAGSARGWLPGRRGQGAHEAPRRRLVLGSRSRTRSACMLAATTRSVSLRSWTGASTSLQPPSRKRSCPAPKKRSSNARRPPQVSAARSTQRSRVAVDQSDR
jgi:hypothetical protein